MKRTLRLSDRLTHRRNFISLSTIFVLMLTANSLFAEENKANQLGAKIYKEQCLSCHGANGEGVTGEYEKTLAGALSLKQLTQRIEKTMPEGSAEDCTGPDAAAVSEYIYSKFYHKAAKARPDFSRLTVTQFHQSVADIVGDFRPGWRNWINDKRGLWVYVNGRSKSKDDKKRKRKKSVNFDKQVPSASADMEWISSFEDIDMSESVSMTWQGSLIPPKTGIYEIVIRSKNGSQLWFNEPNWRASPDIDAYVSKGEEIRDEKLFRHMVRGQLYPFRLKSTKVKSDKDYFLELMWKAPNGMLTVIPTQYCLPDMRPEVPNLEAPFPADDASLGYERGNSISPQWYEAVTKAAIEVATETVEDFDRILKLKADTPDREKKMREFCEKLASRAIRRPLNDATRKLFVDSHFESAKSPEVAAKRSILMTLSSPSFLFPETAQEKPDSYQVAARLALYLWDSIPDDKLMKAAAKDELTNPKKILMYAERMMNDSRAKTKLQGFFNHWLELKRGDNATKDQKVFPNFDEQLMADQRTSLDLFLNDVVWNNESDYRKLLTADYLYLNKRLQNFYGYKSNPESTNEKFEKITVPNKERSGIITHPYLLTVFSYHNNTSPIHRGVFLTRNIVGRSLKPPPNAIKFEDVGFDPNLTMREKVSKFTRSKACMSCHETINPLGFSLENFDGTGRFRTKEKNKTINTTSDFTDDDGKTMKIRSANDVAEFAVNSSAAHRSFVRQMFHHLVKQDTSAYGPETLDNLETSFRNSKFHIRFLCAKIAATAAADGLE